MRRVASLIAAIVAVSVMGTGVAWAAPLVANRQGSNDATEIVYDDATASIETITDTSAIRIPEKLRMWVDVTSDPAAEVGSRLLGEIRIYLRADKAMSFDGVFKIVMLDSATSERTVFELEDAFVLRPRRGMRAHRLDYVFDLPSGTYLYFGLYKPQAV